MPKRLVLRLLILIALYCFATAYPAGAFVNSAYTLARTVAAAPQAQLTLFNTEDAAQKHCPHDTVVWLNTASGIYHLKGQRWYGRTRHGAYVCEKEADAAGDRETRNGQ